jgi:hypothetical protein
MSQQKQPIELAAIILAFVYVAAVAVVSMDIFWWSAA